jgi:predicted PolB exonuclease-like 3'-5' exonuclease
MNCLYIDIETIPSDRMPDVSDIEAPSNYKDQLKIKAYKEDKQFDEWKKEALVSHKGRILCIGYALNDEPVQILTGTEEEIMFGFDAIYGSQFKYIVGHNVASFDLKWIYQRAIKYGLQCRRSLPTKKDGVFDTMTMWGGLDWKDMTSLANIATFLGLPYKKEMSGSSVFDLWQANKLGMIYDYCKNDVEIVREIFNRIK